MEPNTSIQKKEGSIVDVRTPHEFFSGHAAGSINIPLSEIAHRLEEIKSLKQPLILCCATGGRSAQATVYLQRNNIDCENGGSWIDVSYWQTESNP